MTEVIIKLLEAIKETGVEMDELRAYLAIETVLERYTITPKSTELTVATDIPDKFRIYCACKRLEGMALSTIKAYGYIVRSFSDAIAKPLSTITLNDIRAYISFLSKKLKPSSICSQLNCLRSFFGWLRHEKYISENPVEGMKNPKLPKRIKKGLSVVQLEVARNNCRTARDRALLEFLLSTGCRVSEVTNLHLSDIINNSIRVIGKGDKERIVFLNEKAVMYLKIYVNSRKDKSDFIFTSERINKKTNEYYPIGCRAIEDALKKFGLKGGLHLHPHLFRRTCASMLAKNKAAFLTIQKLLGHCDPKTTLGYVSVSDESLQMEHMQCAIA